ncbi:MAG: hypothetical protein V7L11_12860 [Nostoc sp.]|uniref:hypothetical protein n=1 Tax=Nostoc sp. TaxID=1180 RepID=UPI002FF5732F
MLIAVPLLIINELFVDSDRTCGIIIYKNGRLKTLEEQVQSTVFRTSGCVMKAARRRLRLCDVLIFWFW